VVDVDILIPTYGRPLIVNNTLRLLLNQDTRPKRVIVVNQTPGVDSAEFETLQAFQNNGLDLIWINRESPNVMAAQNEAIFAAKSEICLILDDDIIPPSNLVRKHWERHQDGHGWAAVGGQVWHRLPDVDIDQLSLDEPQLGTVIGQDSAVLMPGGPLFGGNWSVRREVVLALGGWDESFVGSANWQEGDLMNRMRANGYKFVWDPDIFIIHVRAPFGGCRISGNMSFSEWTKTANFFLYKYRYPAEKSWKEVIVSALRAGPLRREIVYSPWRWPVAWLGIVKGWWLGRGKANNPVLPKIDFTVNAQQVENQGPQ
jgi:GT2 family glycosyltransferase